VSCDATGEAIRRISFIEGLRRVDLDEDEMVLIDDGHVWDVHPVAASDTVWNVKKVRAPLAWLDGYKGSGVIVGVLDTGVNYEHVDLADHLWVNPGETAGNGVDDDGNGYIDDVYGYDFHNSDSDPDDDNGHGTHCAGTVAGDGTAGIQTGVAPEAHIMSLKVLNLFGSGSESAVWEAIQYALENGAHVMSLSIGWRHDVHDPDRGSWRLACQYALAAGVTMCVASGNERVIGAPAPDNVRTPGDVPPPWLNPAQTLLGGLGPVVTVGATDSLDGLASFSSYGPSEWDTMPPWLDYPYDPEMGLMDPDVCGPGVSVTSLSGFGNTGYEHGWDGTSMATPHAAGAVALMLSKNWTLSPASVDSILETTAVDLGVPGKDNDYGAGRIDAYDAVFATPMPSGPFLDILSPEVVDSLTGNGNGMMDPGESIELVVIVENTGVGDATNVSAILRSSDTLIAIQDSVSSYGTIVGGGTADNRLDPYAVTAHPGTPKGHGAKFMLAISCDQGAWVRYFTLDVGEVLSTDPIGPDLYGYYAYDVTDMVFTEAPTYEWREIRDAGIALNLNNESTVVIDLPFIFPYYGVGYNQFTLSSNGWLSFVLDNAPDSSNSPIPNVDGPSGMIAFIWDDLSPGLEGNAYSYEDTAGSRFIIEFDGVHHSFSQEEETTQVILYDPVAYPTVTGDGEIVIQYKSAVGQSDMTIGIEDASETMGIQFFFDGEYGKGAAQIVPEYAVKFTTDPPESLTTPRLVMEDSRIVDTIMGNGDSLCDPGEVVELIVSLLNGGPDSARVTTGILRTTDPYISVLDSFSTFGDLPPIGGQSSNRDNPFGLSSDSTTPRGHVAELELYAQANGGSYATTLTVELRVGKPVSSDPIGPDDYGYYCYDDTDTRFTECPTFGWIAIDSTQGVYPGVPLDLADNSVAVVELPFTFRYYGIDYDTITISSNGWICMGGELSDYRLNYPVPSSGGPPAMIAGLWDDLDPGNPGQPSEVYWYYDSSRHILIVEFFEVEHYPNGYPELFEYVLYDPLHEPTVTGDGEIVLQYARSIQQEDVTVGIEDETETRGIQYFHEGSYDTAAALLSAGRAVKFTTDPPATGVEGPSRPSGDVARLFLSPGSPSPFKRETTVRFGLSSGGLVSIKVYNCLGQGVRQLVNQRMHPGEHVLRWDGRTDEGLETPGGVYFIRLAVGTETLTSKVLRMR
jgi:subtilisin family serine protease